MLAGLLALSGGIGGFLKPIGNVLARIPWQVYAIVALAILITGLFMSRAHWMDRARTDEASLASICQAVRIAERNPKLDCSKAAAQVTLMGAALDQATAALQKQDAAIQAMAAKSESDRRQAAQARQKAEKAAREADAVSAALEASSRSVPAPRASCEPSKTLQEQWP